jgi:hypothetical protein
MVSGAGSWRNIYTGPRPNQHPNVCTIAADFCLMKDKDMRMKTKPEHDNNNDGFLSSSSRSSSILSSMSMTATPDEHGIDSDNGISEAAAKVVPPPLCRTENVDRYHTGKKRTIQVWSSPVNCPCNHSLRLSFL